MKGFIKFLLKAVLAFLAAVLASLSFPNPISDTGFSILSFFALIPMFLLVRKSLWREVWFIGIVYGFSYYLVYNYWLSTFHPLAILIAPILESVQYMLLFPAMKLPSRLFKKRAYIAQAVIYVAYLYLTQQGFLGYPYGNPTAALWRYPVFIQSVDTFGIWGLALLLALPQGLVAEMIGEHRKPREYKADVVVIVVLYFLNVAYGLGSFAYYRKKAPERTIRIAAIQHSADSWEGGYATYRRNFETLRDLTLEAMEENPDMVVWSETAFVPSVAWHTSYPSNPLTSRLVDEFVEFGKNLPVPLVTGNPEGVWDDRSLPPILQDGTWNVKNYNSTILFDDAVIKETYRKQHLVPFTEHFPYQKQFPRLTAILIANDYNWWEEGTEATVFESDRIRFGTPICFEDTFGYISAGFVAKGADLLINLSNDSWSGSVPAEMQHMQLAVFRAVENRVPLLRSTNSGISCLVTAAGEVVDPMEPFTQSWKIYEVETGKKEGSTFYTEHPDLLAKIAIAAIPAILATGIVTSLRRAKAEKLERLAKRYGNLFGEDDRYEC